MLTETEHQGACRRLYRSINKAAHTITHAPIKTEKLQNCKLQPTLNLSHGTVMLDVRSRTTIYQISCCHCFSHVMFLHSMMPSPLSVTFLNMFGQNVSGPLNILNTSLTSAYFTTLFHFNSLHFDKLSHGWWQFDWLSKTRSKPCKASIKWADGLCQG